MIVTNTKCTLTISNNKMKFYVPSYQEECIYYLDSEVVKVDVVLCFNIRTTSVLILANAISFKNLIQHLNLLKESNVNV